MVNWKNGTKEEVTEHKVHLHCQPSAMSHGHCVHQTRCRAAETLVQSQHCTHYQSQSMWIDLSQLEPLLKLVVEWLHRQIFEINKYNYHFDSKAVGILGSF